MQQHSSGSLVQQLLAGSALYNVRYTASVAYPMHRHRLCNYVLVVRLDMVQQQGVWVAYAAAMRVTTSPRSLAAIFLLSTQNLIQGGCIQFVGTHQV